MAAGGDRAPRRAAGRPAVRRPASPCWRSIPTRSRPRAIASARPPASPIASTRCVLCELARTDAPSLPRACALERRDARAARAGAAPARTSSPARGQLWPTSCAPISTACWPGAARIFADVDSPIALVLPASATPAPPTHAAWAPSAWPASSPATPTAGARPRASCSSGCAAAPTAVVGELEAEARRAAVLGLVCALRAIVEPDQRAHQRRSAAPSAPTPTARSS